MWYDIAKGKVMKFEPIIIKGKHNNATVFSHTAETSAIGQIISLCNLEFFKDSKIVFMPDLHAGAGCVIGTTMTITNKVVPNFVGVDIGCGMFTVILGKPHIDLPAIDNFIKHQIPHGSKNNKEPQYNYVKEINDLICIRDLIKGAKIFNKAIGSLGGGNHFVEINEGKDGTKYLVVHSGSRNMGLKIAKHYQKKAFDYHNGIDEEFEIAKKTLISEYKLAGKRKQIGNALDVLQKKHRRESKIPKDFCYLEKNLMRDYLHDMKIAQEYAVINRKTIARRILEFMDMEIDDLNSFTTIHNYIDLDEMILRKGAVSAKKNEILLVPINMRDGSLLCKGRGNPKWNFSAPHGAGRLMSRTVAKESLSLDDFETSMDGIYTTSVREGTLDEAPMAYKSMQEIIDTTGETMKIIDILTPIYNFKS